MNIDINELEEIKSKFEFVKPFPTKSKAWIQTFSGKKFFPLDPRIEDIDIIDIAHSLSNQCRFSGHVKHFYSVAQHSVYVSYLSKSLAGLMHDGSEAYLVDLPKPIKDSGEFDFYKEKENVLQKLIYQKYCSIESEPIDVKICDMIMLSTEANCLLDNLHPEFKFPTQPLKTLIIEPMNPTQAKEFFLNRFKELQLK